MKKPNLIFSVMASAFFLTPFIASANMAVPYTLSEITRMSLWFLALVFIVNVLIEIGIFFQFFYKRGWPKSVWISVFIANILSWPAFALFNYAFTYPHYTGNAVVIFLEVVVIVFETIVIYALSRKVKLSFFRSFKLSLITNIVTILVGVLIALASL